MSPPGRFDEAPPEGVIDFRLGQPSADLLPLAQLRDAATESLTRAQPLDLNYGVKTGDAGFRAALSAFLQRQAGAAAAPDSLFLTGGNAQGLDIVCARFTRPGDTVLVEDPGFFLSFDQFRDHGLRLVGVPLDGQGLDLDALEAAVRRHRPRLVYTVPTFHNPTGQTLPLHKRERLAAMSREHDFLVVADEVYHMLHTQEPPPPVMGEWAGRGHVVSLGSFSKILAPGLRLGWLQTDPDRIARLEATGMLRCGGNVNHLGSHIARTFMDSGRLDPWLADLREAYAERIAAMDDALNRRLDGVARWETPHGGYFYWLELAPGRDTAALLPAARARGTGFLPGARHSVEGHFDNWLRLSFAHYGPREIDRGVARLARVLR